MRAYDRLCDRCGAPLVSRSEVWDGFCTVCARLLSTPVRAARMERWPLPLVQIYADLHDTWERYGPALLMLAAIGVLALLILAAERWPS